MIALSRFARLATGFLALALTALPLTARADDAPLTVERLRAMTQTSLNEVYAAAEPGKIPDGGSNGTAVFFPGTLLNTPTQLLAAMVWQGKVFNTSEGTLVNKVFGFQGIKAQVYMGKSLFDGQDSIIIDYSRTSILAHSVRDEIREVAPGLYLGRAYIRTWLADFMVVNFILNFN